MLPGRIPHRDGLWKKPPMSKSEPKKDSPTTEKPVERLFPFARRAGIVLTGRDALYRQKKRLAFILVCVDLRPESLQEVLQDFDVLPVVQRYTAAELESHFGLPKARVLGFRKSTLTQSIYASLRPQRINQPRVPRPKDREPRAAKAAAKAAAEASVPKPIRPPGEGH